MFRGIVDLITLWKLLWSSEVCDGTKYSCVPLTAESDEELFAQAVKARIELVDQLAEFDQSLCEMVLNEVDYLDIPPEDLLRALRHATLHHRQVALMCGSSLKNRAIQPLLNNVINILPNPTERYANHIEKSSENLCALAFKVVPNHRFGALTFVRLYSGQLRATSEVYNVNRQCVQTVEKLFEVYADKFKPVSSVEAGNIVAVKGLRHVRRTTFFKFPLL